jgi:hypothetical protein
MGMLERIKKKQLEGFREFVISLETTSPQSRGQIFTSGVLEDPMYMSWVMKNIRTFEDFMKLPPDEIEKVIASQESMVSVFVRALDENTNSSQPLETVVPKLISKIRDELEYVKDVTPEVKISARSHIMKVARKLQNTDLIMGFRWQLPPMEVFYPKTYKDGLTEICFESGVIAAKGMMEKNKRVGPWVHYYDSGRMLAQGEYLDGLKEENWIFYYSNGNERAKGKFFHDQRHGIWTEWDREGVLAEVEYKEGVKS